MKRAELEERFGLSLSEEEFKTFCGFCALPHPDEGERWRMIAAGPFCHQDEGLEIVGSMDEAMQRLGRDVRILAVHDELLVDLEVAKSLRVGLLGCLPGLFMVNIGHLDIPGWDRHVSLDACLLWRKNMER